MIHSSQLFSSSWSLNFQFFLIEYTESKQNYVRWIKWGLLFYPSKLEKLPGRVEQDSRSEFFLLDNKLSRVRAFIKNKILRLSVFKELFTIHFKCNSIMPMYSTLWKQIILGWPGKKYFI